MTDKNLKDLVDFHREHDPVFSVVYEYLTDPIIIEKVLHAAEARHQAHKRAAEPRTPEVQSLLMESVDPGLSGGGMNRPPDPDQEGPVTIHGWQEVIHEWAKGKGWWEQDRSFGDICTLFHTEISEAYEEYRNGHEVTEVYFNPDKPTKPEGIPVELADLVIRVMDYCGHMGIDLQEVIALKHVYNETRSHRHGGKRT